jgi:localization factor PodJL
MSSRQSYLDQLNAGRQRRAHSSMEQLNRSLETLEQRIGRVPERQPEHRDHAERDPLPPIDTGRWEPAARRIDAAYEPRRPEPRTSDRDSSWRGDPSQRGDTSYRTLARDFERLRGQEDSVAAVGKIAGELKGLREELRQQMTTGLQREFDGLRKDIERAYSTPAAAVNSAELTAEFDRLSGTIQTLSEKTDDKALKLLRLELEQVRGALDSLAREETVRSVDRRWDEFDRRFAKFEDRFDEQSRERSTDPAIGALTQRLEQISQAVNDLPESLSLRSLEDKVRTLAGAVDHFARQQDSHRSAPFDVIEERLDEISRAIVASATATTAPNFDPEPFERVEARMTSLARQIEELVEDRPSVEVIDRLNMLSQRVDEIAASGRVPDQAVARLADQVAIIAEKLEQAPAGPDADHLFRGIEQRFDMLSELFDRKQEDAIEHSQAVFRDLERRLQGLASRLDERNAEPALDGGEIMNVIDQRFHELARRFDSRASNAASDAAIANLDARLEDISARLESSRAQVSAVDPAIIRSLEAQVGELSRQLAQPSAAMREFEDIVPRLDDIERSLAGTRDTILEAARQAAESAVRSFSGSKSEMAAVSGLAGDLKTLEELSRRSDERNTKTFEAIHDTLLKIVDRLGTIEESRAVPVIPAVPTRAMALRDAPSIEPEGAMPLAGDLPLPPEEPRPAPAATKRTPAQAAAEAAVAALGTETEPAEQPGRVRSMLGGLTRAFSKREPEPAKTEPSLPAMTPEAPKAELEQPLDPKLANRPLEPGSGAPDLNAIMKRVRDERAQPPRNGEADASRSDFIAAARRAAQAAAADSEVMKRSPDANTGGGSKIGDLLRNKRKPVLIAAAAVLIALAGLQLTKAFLSDGAEVAGGEPAPLVEQAEPDTASVDATGTDATQADATAVEPSAADATSSTEDSASVRMIDGAADAPQGLTPMGAMPAAPEATSTEAPADTAEAPTDTTAAPADSTAAATETLPETAAAATPETAAAETETAAAANAEPVPVDAGPLPLREAAEAGDPKAMFEIGSRYADGRGTKSDMKTAAKWYEKSAELGLAPGQYRIGNFYEKGIGVDRDVA